MDNCLQYYGVNEPPPQRLVLQAGPMSMVFEPDLGFLRYIKLGDVEVLRGVYVAVRDHNWDTVAPVVENVKHEQSGDAFSLSFDVSCIEGEIDFFWHGQITGNSLGKVRFEMDGKAQSTFRRNRIGFCVLHAPSACAGTPCSVEHDDGSVEEGYFPDAISPHQPFMDMRAISHTILPDVTARIAFEGDVFEMEDQRNWTDASYKTYCTPLGLPFPVEVAEGDQVKQAVTVSLDGDLSDVSVDDTGGLVNLTLNGDAPVPLPEIGLGMASDGEALSDQARARLRTLHLSHLRVDLHLSGDEWQRELQLAVIESQALKLNLEVALFVSNQAERELDGLLAKFNELKPDVARWFVFHEDEKSTTEKWVRVAQSVLKDYDPTAPIGAGTNAYFTELNRERPPVEDIECVAYSLNPQVHAFDHASLIETLEAQAWTVKSALSFVGEVPISISPITLQPRFNPNATGPDPIPEPGTLPSQVDTRLAGLFGAAWLVGSLKYLSQAGASSLTYFETSGWRGILDIEGGAPEPYPGVPQGVFPVFHVLVDFGSMIGGEIVPSASSDPMRVDGMVLRSGKWVRFLVANMTAETQVVRVTYAGVDGNVRTETMDETNVEVAKEQPETFRVKKSPELGIGSVNAADDTFELELNPYAVVCAKAIVSE